jgi:hypothetical protein
MTHDCASLRTLLEAEEINALVVREVSVEELQEAMRGWYFNPLLYYPKEVNPLEGERGYDDKYRYLVR